MAKAKYKVGFHGVDGTDSKSFTSLNDVAQYVKARDLGEEWRRATSLQAEFGYYTFHGFTWADIRPTIGGVSEYLPARKPVVSFRKSQFKIPGCHEAWSCGEQVAGIYERDNSVDVCFEFGHHDHAKGEPQWLRCETLNEAKLVIKMRLGIVTDEFRTLDTDGMVR